MFRWMKRLLRVLASSTSAPASWFVEWIRGVVSDSGYPMEGTNCLRYPPVWYAVNKIAGHVGVMPLVLYRRESERERYRATEHPAYRLLKDRPCDWLGATAFKELLTGHALLWGNGRALIIRDRTRQPVELVPLDPLTRSVLIRDTYRGTKRKFHLFTDPKTGEQNVWPDEDVLHIAGLGYDGIEGYSLIEYAKNSWGMGLAAERAANRFFRNNAVPSLVLEAPTGVFRDEKQAESFLKKFNEYHSGSENAGKVGLLREGIKANPLSMSARDAQFIDQRKFQRQEAALWFLLESILGDDASVSYNSLEQKNLAYITNCLLRWLVKWEDECKAKLLTLREQEQDTHFWKFTTAALLRGTTMERYQVYNLGRAMRVLSVNDVRELEDMNPIEGGDEYDNPAIDTQQTNEPPDEEPAKLLAYEAPRLATVVRSGLRELLHMEAIKVRQAAETQANFVGWMDTFYTTWPVRAAATFERLGGTLDQAEHYVAESRARLLDVAGLATQDELIEAIRAETAEWPDRADNWTQTILGEMRCPKF